MARIKDYDEDLSAPKLLRERARDSKGRFIKKDLPPYLGAEQVLNLRTTITSIVMVIIRVAQ